MKQTPTTSRPAFTIMELLVVIGIIVLMVAATIPFVNMMTASGRSDAGLNTVGVAVTAARAYSGRQRASVQIGYSYSGTAILFTPAGELRLVENDQNAEDTANNPLEPMGRNAYRDIPNREYITLPRDSAVAGMIRTNDTYPTFIAPPFAVRFDQFGNLIVSPAVPPPAPSGPADGDPRYVYYDGDYDGEVILTGNGRNRQNPVGGGGSYDPDAWNRDAISADPSLRDPDSGRAELPFDGMEAVTAVVVYDAARFRSDGLAWDTSTAQAIAAWMLTNGKVVVFDRYSGAIARK